jgi:hypothetical protein
VVEHPFLFPVGKNTVEQVQLPASYSDRLGAANLFNHPVTDRVTRRLSRHLKVVSIALRMIPHSVFYKGQCSVTGKGLTNVLTVGSIGLGCVLEFRGKEFQLRPKVQESGVHRQTALMCCIPTCNRRYPPGKRHDQPD